MDVGTQTNRHKSPSNRLANIEWDNRWSCGFSRSLL